MYWQTKLSFWVVYRIYCNKNETHESASTSVGVEEVLNDKSFKLINGNLAVSVLINDLNVRGDVGCSWLETLVHGTVAVHQPLGDFDGFADSVSVAIVSLNNFPESSVVYLARFRHSSLENRPPFSTMVWLVSY